MNYATIKKYDVADGPGVRVSLFVSGCTHHCPGCFNPETWDFEYGKPFDSDVINEILEALQPSYIKGFTLLGGEPFEYKNQLGVLPLLKEIKDRYPTKDIWCYTGYDFEKDLLGDMAKKWSETYEMLSCIDILVDGEFMQDKKNLSLRFRGSSNQRIIRVPESLEAGKVILWDDTKDFSN
ncbi:MAG: anaerobic ribonucleoside-triphosphate reductase activating protein [Lachnospiraceae bacterium]|jgi:anaerobic ribonucleoside-triphosphate reductase activating protein|nr:anaerobic ribonucleoside-triphosphate reductase activating protein [Lachnospiraceae bacterium]